MSTFSTRLAEYKKLSGYSREQLGDVLGVSGKYIGMIERGEKAIDDDSTLSRLLNLLERQIPALSSENRLQERPIESLRGEVGEIDLRWIPVVSWAHAGAAASYEELPAHWQEKIPVAYRGENAFGLIVEGDSMEPRCMAGDIVAVSPSEEPRNGCLVVAKLKDNGVVLRRFMRLPKDVIRLIAYNPIYPAVDYSGRDFHWIYPVHSTVRREWH